MVTRLGVVVSTPGERPGVSGVGGSIISLPKPSHCPMPAPSSSSRDAGEHGKTVSNSAGLWARNHPCHRRDVVVTDTARIERQAGRRGGKSMLASRCAVYEELLDQRKQRADRREFALPRSWDRNPAGMISEASTPRERAHLTDSRRQRFSETGSGSFRVGEFAASAGPAALAGWL